MEHYFTDNPPNIKNRIEISFRFLGVSLKLISDNGVFSKEHVDEGSQLLIESAYLDGLSGEILDLGCGYGVVGLTLKKLDPQLQILGIDVNSHAVALAQENALLNQLDVKFIHHDGIQINQQFDSIIFNPPIRAGKEVIYRLFVEAYEHLKDGGQLYVVMRKQHGAQSAINFLQQHFTQVTRLNRDKGFWVFKATK